jgi:hypothetical protein
LIGMIYGLGAGWLLGALGSATLAAKVLTRMPRVPQVRANEPVEIIE